MLIISPGAAVRGICFRFGIWRRFLRIRKSTLDPLDRDTRLAQSRFVYITWSCLVGTVTVMCRSILTYLLTYSREQSPSWEAKRFSASQEISCILWNPKVHYCSHKCPPFVPNLNQIDLVHNPSSHFLNIYLNITFPSTPVSPRWSLSFRFPHQNSVYVSPLSHTHYVPRPYVGPYA